MISSFRVKGEKGFTLIELLVVIAIIGILAAIAIPQFAAYRRRGYDAQVKSDLKNAATAMETYFTDNNTYTTTVASITPKGYRQTSGINMALGFTAGQTTFLVTGSAASGCAAATGTHNFNSSSGQITGTPCG